MSAAKTKKQLETEAIANCDKDPIHLLNSIQADSWLVATDRNFEQMRYVSANIGQLFDQSANEIAETSPELLFSDTMAHSIRNAAGHRTIEQQREYLGVTDFGDNCCDVTIHASVDCLIIEIQPVQVEDDILARIAEVQLLLARINETNDIDQLLDEVVQNLRALSGYDRVKAYRFLPDGAGEVVAESVRSGIDSFLGLRFPAFDIPPQARKLYLSTPIRVIGDINSDNVALISSQADAAPLDLSLALTRGIVDVHRQYLSNMGVRSTMTLPVVVNGELWGLFAFHNYEVLIPGTPVTLAAELAGKMISLVLTKEAQRAWSRIVDSTTQIAVSVLDSALGEPTNWDTVADHLLQLGGADGVALVFGERVTARHGSLPTDPAILAIRELSNFTDSHVLATDDLCTQLEGHNPHPSAGAAVVTVVGDNSFGVLFFRRAAAQNVTWAGPPEKDIEKTPEGLRLNPRTSFESYVQQSADRSDAWTQEDTQLLYGLHDNLSRLASSQKELRISRNRLELYVRELNHRVRNILSLIQSMTRQSRGTASSMDVFAEHLEQRIAALAVGHDLLTANDRDNVRLAQLVERSLSAFVDLHPNAINVQVADNVTLQPDTAPLITLLLHELASNATRHGALTTPAGRIDLNCSLSSTDLLLDWRESGGPHVQQPERAGFGRSVIENAIPHELDGTSTLNFVSSGVVFQASIPHRYLAEQPTVEFDEVDTESINRPLGRALVVEDSFLISADLVESLRNLGFAPVDSCSNNSSALELIQQYQYTFCVLDVNLRGEFVGPVADAIAQRGVSFVFATGFGSRDRNLEDYPALAILTKPVRHAQLSDLVTGLKKT